MKILILFSLGFSTTQMLASNDCTHTPTEFKCVKYLKNYDGDTITFNIPNVHPLIGDKISVRVSGIDTPEIKGKNQCEKQSARATQRLVENKLKNAKRIDLVKVDRDKYFRILAKVLVDGEDLGSILMKNNLAIAYDGGTKAQWTRCVASPAK